MSTGWETKDLLSPVAGEQKSDDQAHNAVNRVRVPIKEGHKWTRLLMRFCAVKNFGAKWLRQIVARHPMGRMRVMGRICPIRPIGPMLALRLATLA